MIKDLQTKKEDSDKQAAFQEELTSMDGDFNNAKEQLDEGGALTINLLKALIKSKGAESPQGRKKAPFEAAWKKVQDKADWSCTIIFREINEKELDLLENDSSSSDE